MADTGYGTAFQYEATHASGTFADFAEVLEVTPPELSRDTVETTHMTSADAYREFIGGLRDAGEVTVTYNLTPGATASDDIITTHFDSDTVRNYRIEFPNGAYLAFTGICTAHARMAPIEDRLTASATFKLSGKPTMTDAA